MLFLSNKDGKKIATAIECKEKGVEKGIVRLKMTLYLLQTEAVRRERFTATRTMHQTVMQKCAQAAAGAFGKILQSRTRHSDILKSSVQM